MQRIKFGPACVLPRFFLFIYRNNAWWHYSEDIREIGGNTVTIRLLVKTVPKFKVYYTIFLSIFEAFEGWKIKKIPRRARADPSCPAMPDEKQPQVLSFGG